MLTADQLQQLQLRGSGEPDVEGTTVTTVGPRCTWRNSATSSSLGVTFVTANNDGLASLYRVHTGGYAKGYWRETSIDSYPAVYNTTLDDRHEGHCSLHLGVSDQRALRLAVSDWTGEESCGRVAAVASMVITTLRKGFPS